MANPEDDHDEAIIVNFVEDAVIPDPNTIATLCPLELLASRRSRLIGQRPDGLQQALPGVSRQRIEVLERGRRDLDAVSHPRSSLVAG